MTFFKKEKYYVTFNVQDLTAMRTVFWPICDSPSVGVLASTVPIVNWSYESSYLENIAENCGVTRRRS